MAHADCLTFSLRASAFVAGGVLVFEDDDPQPEANENMVGINSAYYRQFSYTMFQRTDNVSIIKKSSIFSIIEWRAAAEQRYKKVEGFAIVTGLLDPPQKAPCNSTHRVT